MDVGLILIFASPVGVPFDKAETSLQLFAREVLPVLKNWQPHATAKAGE